MGVRLNAEGRATAQAEAQAEAAIEPWWPNGLRNNPVCPECGRVFNILFDATDADEFTNGHDCEV